MHPVKVWCPLLLLVFSCFSLKPINKDVAMTTREDYSPAWPHGAIKQEFNNIFMVTGTNIIVFEGVRIQDSRNMIIVRQNSELTLINTVRLSDQGLSELERLGTVKHIIRIGAFHGRDDAFYQHRYGAKLWAIPGMELSHGERIDVDLSTTPLPLNKARLMVFQTTQHKEALIVLDSEQGGVLVSCDSIKNWTRKDEFLDAETFELMRKSGSIGQALIDQTWLSAMQPAQEELEKILSLDFKHLLSAHGDALKNDAKSAVRKSIQAPPHSL